MGTILGCRDAALAMSAGMILRRSPFLRVDFQHKSRRKNENEKISFESMKVEQVLKERMKLSETVGSSDHALYALVHMMWREADVKHGAQKRLCESLGLSYVAMKEIEQTVHQLDSSLRSIGFESSTASNRNSKSWRVTRTCALSAMSPGQLVKVVRPATKYDVTAEGSKEKEGEAREHKFLIRTKDSVDETKSARPKEERVFIHPSSFMFHTGTYSFPWLVYHSMIRTSKPFLRDVTECNAYPMLLFGGRLDVQAAKETVLVDGWVELAANAKIGALVGGLRRRVDELLSRKVEDPSFEIERCPEMEIIIRLIMSDGLATKTTAPTVS